MEKYKLTLPLMVDSDKYEKGCVFNLASISVVNGELFIRAIFPEVVYQDGDIVYIGGEERVYILPEAILNHCESMSPKYEEGDLIDVEKIMSLTGYSKNTIYKMTSTNQIPFIKGPGRRKLFFSKKAILEWIFNEKQNPKG